MWKIVTDFFLRAKQWQIFSLLGATYVAGQIAIGAYFPPNGFSAIPLKLSLLAEAVMTPFVLFFMGWLWSVGKFLRAVVKPSLRMNIGFFHLSVGYATLYLLTALPLLFTRIPPSEAVILPLHFFALFCLGYISYFVSKNLVMKNKNRSVVFGDYALDFLMLLAFPVGVWSIQPRINQLYAEEDARTSSNEMRSRKSCKS